MQTSKWQSQQIQGDLIVLQQVDLVPVLRSALSLMRDAGLQADWEQPTATERQQVAMAVANAALALLDDDTRVVATVQDKVARSSRREVRNPLLTLPSMRAMCQLPDWLRGLNRALYIDICDNSRRLSQELWDNNKATMACYWRVVSVYARHTARALK